MPFENRPLFPFTAEVNERDHLAIGGCDTAELASEFGTPLLVFDDATLRGMCRGFVDAFTSRYANSEVLYAAKAFVNGAIAKIVAEEGLGLGRGLRRGVGGGGGGGRGHEPGLFPR